MSHGAGLDSDAADTGECTSCTAAPGLTAPDSISCCCPHSMSHGAGLDSDAADTGEYTSFRAAPALSVPASSVRCP